jgi:hypothetical protein
MGSLLPDVFLAPGFVAHYGAIVTRSPLTEALHMLLHHSTGKKRYHGVAPMRDKQIKAIGLFHQMDAVIDSNKVQHSHRQR